MQYHMFSVCLVIACMFASMQSVAQYYENGDDGRRCSLCGRMTMKGSRHICKVRKTRSNWTNGNDSGFPSDCDLLTGQKLSKMQKQLPLLGGFKVLGIEIVRDYHGAKPCLKVSGGFGSTTLYELREPEYSSKKAEYIKAKAYYDSNVLLLPVLPTGFNSISSEEFASDVKLILESIVADKNDAAAKKDAAAKENVKRRQESETLYEKMKGLFVKKIFQPRDDADKFADDSFGGEYVEFTLAGNELFSGWKCAYIVTPRGHRIYEISGSKNDISDMEMSNIIRFLETSYGTKLVDNGDGEFSMQGTNSKGNKRVLMVRKSGAGMRISLLDSAGRDRAEAEGSLVIEDRKRKREERLARAPISVWPEYVPESERDTDSLAKSAKRVAVKPSENSVWVVFVDTLTRRHSRFVVGEDTPRVPLDGLIERENAK